MNPVAELPVDLARDLPGWAALITALLLLLGSGLTLIGCFGLLRLRGFYDRVHAPTLGTTLGIFCVLAASALYFSLLRSRPVLHEALIFLLIVITTPVTLMLLTRAALYRDRSEGSPEVTSERISRPDPGHDEAATQAPPG